MSAIGPVFDVQAQPCQLGELLARGGEGEVYPLLHRPEILVKRYHASELQKRGQALQDKVEAMRHLAGLRNHPAMSWPLISVYDGKRRWIGYAMRRVEGVPMHALAHAMLYRKHFPALDRIGLTGYLLRLIELLQTLHQQGIRMGDYNLQNIFCTPGTDKVALIDCDSYQLDVNGKHYPCPVGSADLTAPEHQGRPFSQIVRTEASEAFSLAVILFKCLMLGRHPYDVVGGEDPVTNLRQGKFAYGVGNTGIPQGPWYNIWSHMPYSLKDLFITTFTEGAQDPARRPGLADWHQALTRYQREMQKGWHQVAIRPEQPKSRDYRGSRSQSAC